MAKIERRQFLRAGATLVVAAAAAPLVGRAAAAVPPRKLVIVLASGGWDATYALDPKPGSTEIDAPEGELRRFGEIPILTHAERPSVTAFFERYGALSTVINGVQVRSFVHVDCMKRVMTGTASDQNPDFGAVTASVHAPELPVPYLVLGNSALSGPLAAMTGRAGTTNQLASLLSSSAYDPLVPASGFSPDDVENDLIQRHLTASAERFRAVRGQGRSNSVQIDAFVRSLERQGLLRRFAVENGGFGAREYTPDLGVQVEVALSALQGGLCHSVMLESGDWDTHQNNARQSQKHEALFEGLVSLTQGLEDRSLIDDTVVVVLSEMGRTPKFNQSLGKDHWPVTSALVYGAGLPGNRVLGETDELLAARSVDLGSGAAASTGKQLQTSNFVAGLLRAVGVDPEDHLPGAEPFDALSG